MRGLGRIKRAVARVSRAIVPAAAILMYHRVADVSADPQLITVSPKHFAQHLQYIRQSCEAIRLLDLVEFMRQGRLPKRAVALTFDDGYVDMARHTGQILLSARMPATVFVTSGLVDSSRCFWWDELNHLLLSPGRLPPWLRLHVGDQDREWPTSNPETRQLAHQALSRLLERLSDDEQRDILAAIRSWSGHESVECDEQRAMNSEELAKLAKTGLVDVGAHTVSHPVLSSLPRDRQWAEIVGSRRHLEAILASPVLSFAYPHGTTSDYTHETAELVETAGFQAACTTVSGCVETSSDRFQLPRFWVGDWDLETFRRNLEYFFLV